MEKALEQFYQVTLDPYRTVSEYKQKSGNKVISVFPMWIPEEISDQATFIPDVLAAQAFSIRKVGLGARPR